MFKWGQSQHRAFHKRKIESHEKESEHIPCGLGALRIPGVIAEEFA